MPATLKNWRTQQVEHQKQHYERKHHDSSKREWITIDGEGWGRDDTGRQYYRFMIAANESGFQMRVRHDDSPALTMDQALDWLSSIPSNYRLWCQRTQKEWHPPLIGGFALGYDYAHILIDITEEQLDKLLRNQDFESPPTKLTPRFAAKLTAGNLRIYTAVEPHIELVSISDTFKYYQAAFLKVMKAYAEPRQWAIIEAGKSRRDTDAEHDMDTEMVYCLNECKVHSRAMNDLSRAIHEMNLTPSGWYGPGSLAGSALKKHKTKLYWKPDSEQPSGLEDAARYAYIGGRFETTGHGWLDRMYGHDIRSAYPSSMVLLPCLSHGTWYECFGSEAQTAMESGGLALGLVDWHCDNPPGGWGPYPSRYIDRTGRYLGEGRLPAWPFTGRNWIWSEEYQAGRYLCSHTEVKQAWVYERKCDCVPFNWVPSYYDLRYLLREQGNEIGEKVVKLILNSLYGKIAQTIGKPPVPTWIWAGLITQSARSKLLTAIRSNPEACVMVATDAIYSKEPLPLDFGKALGQWDGPEEYGRTLIVQAGFWRDYDHPEHQKTRGIAKKYLEGDKDHLPLWPVFEQLWIAIVGKNADIHAAVVPVRYSDHIGLQRARQYGIDRLGQWTDDAYQDIRFRVDKRPHLIGEPSPSGWWKSAPTRTDRVGEQLSLGVTISDQYIREDRSMMDQWFIVEQPDAAEWGYTDD